MGRMPNHRSGKQPSESREVSELASADETNACPSRSASGRADADAHDDVEDPARRAAHDLAWPDGTGAESTARRTPRGEKLWSIWAA